MTTASAGSKTELRQRFSARRRAMTDAARATAREAVAGHVLHRCRVENWTCVAGYEPLPTEPGSVALLSGLAAAGVGVLVPVTLPDRDLDWVRWGTTELLGVDAIGAASAVLVPALAVAADGARLGRGGGSYDRALPRCASGTPLLALVFDSELVDILPIDPWDRPVTGVVQPSGHTALPRNTGVAGLR